MSELELPPGGDLDLLLLGKTGHGKSSTGNTILQRQCFETSSDGDSVTAETQIGFSKIDNRVIKVADTPGIFDTKLNEKDSVQLVINAFSNAVVQCPKGFHALIVAIRFGIRMTDEEKRAIQMLKRILGEDIIKTYLIVAVTHGDIFEDESEESKISFMDWCQRQKGYLKEFFAECNYRCILFNNRTKDQAKKKAQIVELVKMVDAVSDRGAKRYTNEYFALAKQEREKVISEMKMPEVEEEVTRDIQLILNHIQILQKSDGQVAIQELTELNLQINDLKKRCPDSERLHSLMQTVSTLADATKYNQKSMQKAEADIKSYYKHEVSPNITVVNTNTSVKVADNINGTVHCFPGTSKVTLENGASIPLEKLKVGDKVLARKDSRGLQFDKVYMFGHKESEVFGDFVVLSTAIQKVFVTAGHYVYCLKDGSEQCVAAGKVSVGDSLFIATAEGLVPHIVLGITYERKKGLFAPFTNSGTLIVDDVLVSCYINVLPPKTCHTYLWPMRQLYRVSPRTLAFINGSSAQHPIPRPAKLALKFM